MDAFLNPYLSALQPRRDLEDLSSSWGVSVQLEGGPCFQVPVEAGQTYGDVKRQLARLAQEAAQKLAQAVGEADAEEQVRGMGLSLLLLVVICKGRQLQ